MLQTFGEFAEFETSVILPHFRVTPLTLPLQNIRSSGFIQYSWYAFRNTPSILAGYFMYQYIRNGGNRLYLQQTREGVLQVWLLSLSAEISYQWHDWMNEVQTFYVIFAPYCREPKLVTTPVGPETTRNAIETPKLISITSIYLN
jgi:hypothetical protein